ncbi:MAG: pyruvate formate lyase family protein [Treponema sp.]|jgi:formate C-acetyltransferase|nr:pyruvate formate lyase family protein [Treponema sp.]
MSITVTSKPLTYREKVDILRRQKEEMTQKKMKHWTRPGHFDTDDKGYIVPPEGYSFELEPNEPKDPDHRVYGAKQWAKNFYRFLDLHPPYVDPYSSLAGAYMDKLEWHNSGGWFPRDDYPELRVFHQLYDLVSGVHGAHHFHHDVGEIGFKLGWKGILEKIRHHKQVHKDDPDKLAFLEAEETVVLGIQEWIRHNADLARDMAETERDPDFKANLKRMAAMNYRLINEPPETFIEACQWLTWFLLQSSMYNGSGAGGALELLLNPFFEKDMAEGRLSEDEAIYHLACLLLKDTQYFEIGGTYPDGRDRTGKISWLTIEASHWLRIPTALCLRIHENINRDFVKKSVEYMFQDKTSNPSYIGDKCMVEGFMKNGYTEELARRRYKTGCNWCALPGIEYTLNDTVKINMAKVFEVAYEQMLSDSERSTDNLWKLFDKHLGKAVEVIKDSVDLHTERSWFYRPELALDFMCHGPIEKGLDISHGGVEYYNFGIDGAALGTVADSFASLERAVEEEGVMTWDEVDAALKANWKGFEDKRLYMKNTPRYGFGGTKADDYAKRIVECLNHHVKKCPTPKGFNCIPGLFSWANTIGMGKAVKATPNGRFAHEPITHGANPEPGFRESGALTAMGIAVAGVQPGYGNTAPIQLEIDPVLAKGDEGVENITSFLMTYCNDLKGSLVNINIVDRDRILDAYEHPERHPDLVVRITGFSVYFSTLTPEFRKLVVDRIIQN